MDPLISSGHIYTFLLKDYIIAAHICVILECCYEFPNIYVQSISTYMGLLLLCTHSLCNHESSTERDPYIAAIPE